MDFFKPILLYFFRAKSGNTNFGDEVSYFIVKKSLGRVILQARTSKRLIFIYDNHFHLSSLFIQKDFRKHNRLFAVGSILGPKVKNNDVIWGSGFISNDEILNTEVNQLNVLAVRGKKTLRKLKELNIPTHDNIALGDPGLLISKFVQACEPSKEMIVIVPHYIHKDIFDELSIISKTAFQVVNARDDYIPIAKIISGASLVLSSSLHGIIFAHAYGIPAIRLIFEEKQLKGGSYKFEDYMSIFEESVKLPLYRVNTNDLELNIDSILKSYSPAAPSKEKVNSIQDNLINVLKNHYSIEW